MYSAVRVTLNNYWKSSSQISKCPCCSDFVTVIKYDWEKFCQIDLLPVVILALLYSRDVLCIDWYLFLGM